MTMWEVIDGNRKLIKVFNTEEEAHQWTAQENARKASGQNMHRVADSLENAVNILKVAIMGF